ncbi:MAG TPA: hypothetical protein VEL07_16485 [Planctomycetota bacterium]|nr:hypothetical protein [Planctomycetota bacterium]
MEPSSRNGPAVSPITVTYRRARDAQARDGEPLDATLTEAVERILRRKLLGGDAPMSADD